MKHIKDENDRMITITIAVPRDMIEKLTYVSDERNTSISHTVRELMKTSRTLQEMYDFIKDFNNESGMPD